MHDIINLLLQKKGELNESKETAIAEALIKIDEEFAERAKTIDTLLATAGYDEPVVAPVVEEVAVTEVEVNDNVAVAATDNLGLRVF